MRYAAVRYDTVQYDTALAFEFCEGELGDLIVEAKVRGYERLREVTLLCRHVSHHSTTHPVEQSSALGDEDHPTSALSQHSLHHRDQH